MRSSLRVQALHEERQAVAALEEQFQMQFDFGGVQSEAAAAGLLRASKGATVQGVRASAALAPCLLS